MWGGESLLPTVGDNNVSHLSIFIYEHIYPGKKQGIKKTLRTNALNMSSQKGDDE